MITAAQIESLHDHDSKKMANPWTFELDGQWWTGASDGKCMLFVRGVPGEYPPNSSEESMGYAKELATVGVNAPVIVKADMQLADLKKWVGPFERDKPCRECDGNGTEECPTCGHEDDCSWCHGSGGKFAQPRYGMLHQCGFNRNLLAKWLEYLDGDTITVTTFEDSHPAHWHKKDLSPVKFDGGSWVLWCMPCKPDSMDEEAEWPRYPNQ